MNSGNVVGDTSWVYPSVWRYAEVLLWHDSLYAAIAQMSIDGRLTNSARRT